MHLVGVARAATVGDVLQFELDVGDHLGVEQLAQFFRAEQVVEQVAVERQRGGTTLGERRVAFVHVRRNPVEEQALGERRSLWRVDGDEPDGPRTQPRQHVA